MKTKEVGVISSKKGKVVLMSSEALENIAARLKVSSAALINDSKAVEFNFGKPIVAGIDVAEAVYEDGLVCPAAILGLVPEEFVRFLNEDEESFAEYSTKHRLYREGLKSGDDRHQQICVEYADKVLNRVTRHNEALDEALGITERRGVHGEILKS